MTNNRPLRVCYFGTYRESYSRNQMMIAGLRLNGIHVTECHETLWHGIEDRVRVTRGDLFKPSFIWRVVSVYFRLLKRYLHEGDYDILVVGYPGQFDVFISRILTWFKRRPLVWDVFMSIYLIAVERGLDKKNKFIIGLIHFIEKMALKFPNILILDTSEYVSWFTRNYGISPSRFRLVPTGADDRIFYPSIHSPTTDNKFRILYYGTFIPNHGVMYILESARLLVGEKEILFELVGNGPELDIAKQYADQNHLQNVSFIEWMEKDKLINLINQADVCLGAFGTTPQSLMTIQNKIYEAMAMRKPLISGDSPAIRHGFTHGEHIFLCERANGQALAEAILTLWRNPTLCENIAQNGYRLFTERYNLLNNGKLVETYLNELIE